MKHIIAAALLAASCAVEAPRMSETEQNMRCQRNCDGDGGGVTYPQAGGIVTRWAQSQSGQRITWGCDTVEVNDAVGYGCYVAFDNPFDGKRYTASCTVWDNTEASGGSGTNSCHIVANDGS